MTLVKMAFHLTILFQWRAGLWLLAATVLVALQCPHSGATYIYEKGTKVGEKTNEIGLDHIEHVKRYGPAFKNDREISRFLKIYGLEMMLWRCRNAIQPYWNWRPISSVELYCEAIGRLRRVSWYHNDQKIDIGRGQSSVKGIHYSHMIMPHYANGRYFSRWIDFRLKIHNATTEDSGLYRFRAWSPSGYSEDQMIYVDISEKKRKKRRRKGDHRQVRSWHRFYQLQLERQLAEAAGASNVTSPTQKTGQGSPREVGLI